MSRFITVSGTDSKKSPLFSKIISHYLKLNQKFAMEWQWQDVPWWYNERANLSLIAASFWRIGGIAFEEYTSTKDFSIQHSSRSKHTSYSGRNDLYAKYGKREMVFEAKRIYVTANSNSPIYIRRALDRACSDAKAIKHNGAIKYGILFAVPRFSLKNIYLIDEQINRWIHNLKNVKYSAAGWIFPASSRISIHWQNKWHFPGVAVLIRKI